MGCWNKTCGLSNLHITAGTPVYVFVLEKNKTYDHCYSTGLFTPLLLPFESTYDDYGGGEDSHGIALNLIMGGIKKDLVEMEVGENEYHDIEVKKEGFTPEKFFEAVHEDRLQIKGRFDSEPTPIYFTMFRKDIVDHILENRRIQDYVGDGKGTCGWGNNYVQYKFADIVADIRPLLDEAMEKITRAKEETALVNYMLYDGFEGMFPYGHPNKVAKWMRGDSYRYSRIVDMKAVIRKGLEVGTETALENLAKVLEEHLKAIFIDGFMHAARKTWIPGGHEGSQSSSAGALKLLNAGIQKAIDAEQAEWMAENVGEEDEYIEE